VQLLRWCWSWCLSFCSTLYFPLSPALVKKAAFQAAFFTRGDSPRTFCNDPVTELVRRAISLSIPFDQHGLHQQVDMKRGGIAEVESYAGSAQAPDHVGRNVQTAHVNGGS